MDLLAQYSGDSDEDAAAEETAAVPRVAPSAPLDIAPRVNTANMTLVTEEDGKQVVVPVAETQSLHGAPRPNLSTDRPGRPPVNERRGAFGRCSTRRE